jgi:hypothetical protein
MLLLWQLLLELAQLIRAFAAVSAYSNCWSPHLTFHCYICWDQGCMISTSSNNSRLY